MFRRRLPVIGLLVLTSLAATARRSSAQPLLGEYAVLGLQRTVLRPGARVTAGAVGTAGGTLVLRNHVRIGGTVAADMIRLDNDATASRFFCRFVVLSHGGGAVGGPVVGGGALPGCRAFTPPLVDPTLLAPVAVVPGGTDVRVRPFSGTAPLPAASLRDVVVGRGALLQLAGGSYTARSIRIAPNGRLVCIDACRIGVLERIVLAPRAQLGAGAPLRADRVRFDLGASTASVFRAGPRAAVAGTVFAPSATVLLGPHGSYRGAYIGRIVSVGRSATVRADSAFGS